MKKLFVNGLPSTAKEDSLRSLFAQFGTVHSIEVPIDIFTGKCRGIAFVEMEGHEARAAIAELNGKTFEGNPVRVRFEQKNSKNYKGRRR